MPARRAILSLLIIVSSFASWAQNFPAYVDGSPVAINTQTGDVIPLVRGGANGNTFKIDPALLGLPQPVINGDCLIGSGGVAIWGSCAGGAAVSSVVNSDGTLTISPTTGSVVASLALGHPNTWTGQQSFVAPILGTPASGLATNLTGLPISTGISGLGTGVATALGVNVGTAGSVLVNGGALGTPLSGTLTNATGLPISSGVSGLGTGVATAAAANLSANGGLATTIASGATALGTGAISSAACATAVIATATNTATTDVVTASFNGDPTAVTGYIPATAGMLTIFIYPTANNVNFKVCNNTNASITPGAITLNWRVTR